MSQVVQVAASVTPCRHDTGSTVLDERWHVRVRASAADFGGDVLGTDQVSMTLQLAVRAAEPPPFGLRSPLSAGRTCRGGAMFIDNSNLDPSSFGLVAQRLQQMDAAPLSQPEVLRTTDVTVSDAPQIADHQGAGPLFDHEGNHLLGRLVVGLMDATTVTSVQLTLPRSVSAPAARASLPALRCLAGCSDLASLAIAQVQIVVGADGAPRNQQSCLLSHDGVGMNDAEINPGHMLWVEIELLNRDRGGNVQP